MPAAITDQRFGGRPWLHALLLAIALPATVPAQLQVGDICRVKGQERNTLQGMGIVVGLKGTGDGAYAPTTRALVQVMHNLGVPMTGGADGRLLLDELKDGKNTALVFVAADVPAHGGRQGDEIDCTVSAAHAKSLEGGVLFMTPMLGPPKAGQRPEDARIYAFAHGPLHLDDQNNPTTAKISLGCRLEQSFHNPFVKDNKITLVLNRHHARFAVAEEVAFAINSQKEFQDSANPRPRGLAKAIDQLSIEVAIPDKYRDDLVSFVSLVLEQRLYNIPNDSVVVVNETTGVITMSADLEIAPSAVTHENMVIDIGNGLGVSQFVELDPNAVDTAAPTLKALVQSMNALRVSAKDMIQIIRELDHSGAIYGHVIYRR
jgi:flagellar P-ring protein FlgI